MKTKISFVRILVLAGLLAVAVSQNARSQETYGGAYPAWTESFNHQPISETLVTTYRILGDGNKNYHGHRVKAMAEIKEAATALNIELPLAGKGGKAKQAISDARLTVSGRLLEQLQVRLADDARAEVREHVQKAKDQLVRALKVRAAVDAAEADREEAAARQK